MLPQYNFFFLLDVYLFIGSSSYSNCIFCLSLLPLMKLAVVTALPFIFETTYALSVWKFPAVNVPSNSLHFFFLLKNYRLENRLHLRVGPSNDIKSNLSPTTHQLHQWLLLLSPLLYSRAAYILPCIGNKFNLPKRDLFPVRSISQYFFFSD